MLHGDHYQITAYMDLCVRMSHPRTKITTQLDLTRSSENHRTTPYRPWPYQQLPYRRTKEKYGHWKRTENQDHDVQQLRSNPTEPYQIEIKMGRSMSGSTISTKSLSNSHEYKLWLEFQLWRGFRSPWETSRCPRQKHLTSANAVRSTEYATLYSQAIAQGTGNQAVWSSALKRSRNPTIEKNVGTLFLLMQGASYGKVGRSMTYTGRREADRLTPCSWRSKSNWVIRLLSVVRSLTRGLR